MNGNYNIKTLIGNINIHTKVEDPYVIKLDEKATFDHLEVLGCEEILCDLDFNKFKSLKCIYGWLIDKNEILHPIQNVLPLTKKYNFNEFVLNRFIPFSLMMDLEISDSEYSPSESFSEYEEEELI